MDDVRVAGPARANFRAGRLASYAFDVEATIGHNPMRYLFARRFSGASDRALTVIFVMKPEVLFGTYVWIEEDSSLSTCLIHTYLPTMAKPVQVVDRLVFDCLPLTDIGYIDLMAWSHPVLQSTGPGCCQEADAQPRLSKHCRSGPSAFGDLHVTELATARQGIVVSRLVTQYGRQTRRWDALDFGGADEDFLPRRVQVSRMDSGHRTEFCRTSPAVAIPGSDFDAPPEMLRDLVEQHLGGRPR